MKSTSSARSVRAAKFYRQSASAIALTLAAIAVPGIAHAQDVADQADDAAKDDDKAIIITGFRAALQGAVSTKKDSDQVVESVKAEDIGKLPDNSIGESIARLPGLTSQRSNGRANIIAIRGFGPDFSTTLLNGRPQTSTGDNRNIEFDQFPSELVSAVTVYKSPIASVLGQGLAGTIDVQTLRPLEVGKAITAIGARGSYADLGKLNAGSKDMGYRVNGTFVRQFLDDTLGITISGSYVDEPYQVQEFNAWGYFDPDGSGNLAPSGSKSYVTSTELKRYGINSTIQWKPAPNFMVTLDGFYSHFQDLEEKRGIELPFSYFGAVWDGTGAVAKDGVYQTGTFRNVQGVVRNDRFDRTADLYSFGFNAKYTGDDGWNAFFDFGYSHTDRTELSFQGYAGTGYNWRTPETDVTDTIGFINSGKGISFTHQLDYSDPSLIRLTDPLGWGGSNIQQGYYNDRKVADDLQQYRVEVSHDFEDKFLSAVKFGLAYTRQSKELDPIEYFMVLPGGATIAPLPAQYQLASTDLSYLGLGPILSYDPRTLLNDGITQFAPNTSNDVLSKYYKVNENLMTSYVQGSIKSDLGAAELTGNFGVQAIHTQQRSTGYIYPPSGPVLQRIGADYWDLLPSANLSLRFDNDIVVRLAAAREVQRPRMVDMRLGIGYGIDTSAPGQPIIRGGGGNPLLRPYRANAVDLTIEKYFGRKGYVALQLYYKDIKSFIYNGRIPFDYGAFPAPTGAGAYPGLPSIGSLDAPINTGGGTLYGGELASTLPLDVFTSALDGFGITGGVGYTITRVKDQNGVIGQIPGYSKWVANGTAFFEKWGFSARGSIRYRSGFLGDFGAFDGNTQRKSALSETIVDAQIGYDFNSGALKGLSVYVQGQNLTDEPFVSVADPGKPATVTDYQVYGRRFLAGFTYKF